MRFYYFAMGCVILTDYKDWRVKMCCDGVELSVR